MIKKTIIQLTILLMLLFSFNLFAQNAGISVLNQIAGLLSHTL